jgi:hypothetical protein
VTQPREQPRHGPRRATAIPAFEPRIIPKQQRRIPGLDDKILALLHGYSSSRGNGTGSDVDIDPSISRALRCAHAKRIYFFYLNGVLIPMPRAAILARRGSAPWVN